MAQRESYNLEHLQLVSDRLGVTTSRVIPSRRGGVVIGSTAEEDLVIKIADLGNLETECNIVPARSHGIENEAHTLSAIPGAVTPKIRHFARDNSMGIVYSAAEWVHGDSPIANTHSVSPVGIITRLLYAMKQIHDHDVIHGDVQPENMLIRKSDSELVMLDFEFAKHTTKPELSLPGLYHYLSPVAAEYVLDSPHCPVTIAEETFAVAATALVLVTRRPYPVDYSDQATNRQSRLREIVRGRYSIAGAKPDDMGIAIALQSFLQAEPHERPATIADLTDALGVNVRSV